MKQVDAPNCICFPLDDDDTEYTLKCFDRITHLDYIKDENKPFWAVYYYDPEIERARLGVIGGTSPYSYIVYKGVKYEIEKPSSILYQILYKVEYKEEEVEEDFF